MNERDYEIEIDWETKTVNFLPKDPEAKEVVVDRNHLMQFLKEAWEEGPPGSPA